MPWKKLVDCDSSDVRIWASSAPALNFLREIDERKEVALRKLIKQPTEENAAIVRAFSLVTSMIIDAQNSR